MKVKDDEITLTFEIIDESNEMRATDRLAYRIRRNQQFRIFTLEILALIVIISVLCNVISDLFVNLFIVGVDIAAVGKNTTILIISLITVIIISLLIFSFEKRYFSGALGTFLKYKYRVKTKSYISAEEEANNI